MRHLDLSPIYKSAIGFDRLANIFDDVMRFDTQPNYPPYNIERLSDNEYVITMAVAGFSEADLDIEVKGNALKITGNTVKNDEKKEYLHKGIANRNFERRFQLDDHVKVTEAKLENGMLYVNLLREIPEALKPRKVTINNGDNKVLIDNKVA